MRARKIRANLIHRQRKIVPDQIHEQFPDLPDPSVIEGQQAEHIFAEVWEVEREEQSDVHGFECSSAISSNDLAISSDNSWLSTLRQVELGVA